MNSKSNYNDVLYNINHERINWLEVQISITPLIFLAVCVYMKLEQPLDYQNYFMLEDSPVEYATFLAYFLASLFSALIARMLFMNSELTFSILYVILCLGLFFIAMEEISWGQRIFGIVTPEILNEYNRQNELNIHNMLGRDPLHWLYIVVGFYGAFARRLIPGNINRQYSRQIDLLTPKYSQVLYFLPAMMLYLYYEIPMRYLMRRFGEGIQYSQSFLTEANWCGGFKYFMHAKDQEPIELLLAIGFLIFVATNFFRLRKDNQ